MIIVDGKYVFNIEVGEFKDFLNWDDLIDFRLYEIAGCVLPAFELKFKFTTPEIRNYLVENNILGITMGSSLNDMQTHPFRILEKNINSYAQEYYLAEINGVFDAVPFLQETNTEVIKTGDGGIPAIQALSSLASRYFKFSTNISSNSSSQKWLRCKKTLRQFMTDIWLHLSLPNSFPAVTITKGGTFIVKDMISSITQKPDWTFSSNPRANSSDIQMSGSPEVFNDTGFVNNIVNNMINEIFNMDTGVVSEYQFVKKAYLANTSFLESPNVSSRNNMTFLQNSNVHGDYWKAYSQNLAFLTFFSGARVLLTFTDLFIDNMKVLDLAELSTLGHGGNSETEGHYSGKYIISNIVRCIDETKTFRTHVLLTRESLNDIYDVEAIKANKASVPTVPEDKEFTTAQVKVDTIFGLIRDAILSRGFQLNLPNIKVLLQEAVNTLGLPDIGIDFSGIYLLKKYVLSSVEKTIYFDVAKQIYLFLKYKGDAILLSDNSLIMSTLNSGLFSSFVNNGFMNIPNVGITKLDSENFTSSIFAWYVQGIIDENNVNTGNAELDELIKQSVSFVKNEGTIPRPNTTVGSIYWGQSDREVIDETNINSLFSIESDKRYLNKTLSCKNGYIYIVYPKFMGEPVIKINSKEYTNLDIKIGNLKISDKSFGDFYIIRTLDKFNSKTTLELK